jgi:hypothetical protein
MSEFDEKKNKITLKLVYYGPALSGKTTNLMCLHDKLSPELKGDMMVLETKNDRTLFFDLLPMGITAPSGLLVKLKVYTVPGQVAHDSTRKAVLSRADGVVFVADSQRTQSINNAESFENLANNLARLGMDIEKTPVIVQFNKRDLPNILTEEEVKARWEKTPWPLYFSNALLGHGVEETFRALLRLVYAFIDNEYDMNKKHQLDEAAFVSGIVGTDVQQAIRSG